MATLYRTKGADPEKGSPSGHNLPRRATDEPALRPIRALLVRLERLDVINQGLDALIHLHWIIWIQRPE